MNEEHGSKIFITHSWNDIDFARKLYDDLIAQGMLVWLDDKTLQVGHRMAEEINRGLEWCDVYLPILSKAALISPWCWEEINAAISLCNDASRGGCPRIVPVLAERCQLPAILKSRLYVDLTVDYATGFSKVVSAIRSFHVEREQEPSETAVETTEDRGSHMGVGTNKPEQARVVEIPAVSTPPAQTPAVAYLPAQTPIVFDPPAQTPVVSGPPARIPANPFIVILIAGLTILAAGAAIVNYPFAEPVTEAIARSDHAAMLSAAISTLVFVPPTPTETPTAVASPSPLPTIMTTPAIARAPATRKPTVSPSPVPTRTPSVLPGLYVTRIATDPAIIGFYDDVAFRVTFLNTTGAAQTVRWLVKIYQCSEYGCTADDLRHSSGESTTFENTIPVGSVELIARRWSTGIGPCNYVARVFYLNVNNNPIEFARTDGTALYNNLSLCH